MGQRMRLDGSCHCGAVTFSLETRYPVPYQLCFCSICRKVQGGGGSAINLSGDYASLVVRGGDNVSRFHATMREPGKPPHESPAERTFCRRCGSGLWLYDARWPELIHPYASAIDTPLPTPPARTRIMLDDKPAWVEVGQGPGDLAFEGYPEESIAQWHERMGVVADSGSGS